MKILEDRLYNRLVPTEKEYLIDKEELKRYNESEDKENFNLNYSKEIYLPKIVTIEYCNEHYEEIEVPEELQQEIK